MIRLLKNIFQNIHNFLVKEEDFLKYEEQLIANSLKRSKKEFCHYIFKKWFIPHSGNDHAPSITHHHTLGTFILAIFLFKLVAVGVLMPVDYSYAGGVSSAELVFMTNQARAEKHLSQLKVSDELVRAARLKAEDMFEYGYWSHNSPTGVSPWHWFDEIGYNYEHAGENLAMDFYSSEGVFSGWENSRKHWENIVNPNFREIGIAVVPGIFDGKNTTIIVQLFGTRSGSKIPPTRLIDSKEANNADKDSTERVLKQPEIMIPKENSYLKNPKPLLMGKADSQVLVTVLDDKFNLGQVSTDDYGYYSYRAPELYDGEHVFKSFSTDGELKSEYSKPVTIFIDTKAPVFNLDNLEILHEKIDSADVFKLKLALEEDVSLLQAVYKDRKVDFVFSDSGFFKGVLKFNQSEQRNEYPITLYATDQALNSAVLDLKLTPVLDKYDPKVLGESTENEDSFVISSAPLNQTKGIGSGQAEKSKLKDGDLSATVEMTRSSEVERTKSSEVGRTKQDEGIKNEKLKMINEGEEEISNERMHVINPNTSEWFMEGEEEISNERMHVINPNTSEWFMEGAEEDDEEEKVVAKSDLVKPVSSEQKQAEMLSPNQEKEIAEELSVFAKYGKVFTLIVGFILFFAYLLQAYVIYHNGLKEGKSHPLFHAIGVLCVMILILMN